MRRGRFKQQRQAIVAVVQRERAAVVKAFLIATAEWGLLDRLKLSWKIVTKNFAKEVKKMTVYAVIDKSGSLVRVERFPEKARRFAADGYTVHELIAQQYPNGALHAENELGILRVEAGVKTWTPKTKKAESKKSIDD